MTEDRRKELQGIAKDMLPDPIIVIGYLEHQLDLMAKVIEDLTKLVDTSTMTAEEKNRIQALQGLLEHSSIDFEDLDNPLQSYKLPSAKGLKKRTRDVQRRYLEKQQKEGLL